MNVDALPLIESNKYENHFFLCTSNHKIKAMEMVKPLVDDVVALEEGVIMHDAVLGRDVLVLAPVLFLRSDNVRQAEMTMNKGSKANHPCRYCY
jgi:hypothetical protein